MTDVTAAMFLETENSPVLPRAGDDVSKIFGKELVIESNLIAFQMDLSKGVGSEIEHVVVDVDFGQTPALDSHVSFNFIPCSLTAFHLL